MKILILSLCKYRYSIRSTIDNDNVFRVAYLEQHFSEIGFRVLRFT